MALKTNHHNSKNHYMKSVLGLNVGCKEIKFCYLGWLKHYRVYIQHIEGLHCAKYNGVIGKLKLQTCISSLPSISHFLLRQ